MNFEGITSIEELFKAFKKAEVNINDILKTFIEEKQKAS